MAFENNQTEPNLPTGDNDKRESVNHLPKYFRTNFNKKFLSSTLDQMLQPGVVENVNGFVGKKNAKAFDYAKDIYIQENNVDRENYQLEPATLIKDNLGNVSYYADYNDFINSIKIRNGNYKNHDSINASETYAWDPHIDWDKFINFREYYWLPNGPQTVTVVGQSKEVQSTYSIQLKDNIDNLTYLFTPDGLSNNPTITLYRGQTYRFKVDVPSYPITFATRITFTPGREYGDPVTNTSLIFDNGITKFDTDGNIIEDAFLEEGVIEFVVPETAPDTLFYISKDDPNLSGIIKIFDILENTEINVENEIIGKATYTTSANFPLSNGMKINFAGSVFPEKYSQGEWYVEGVGDQINLISSDTLSLSSLFVNDIEVEFDDNGFDQLPFSEALGYPLQKDYITINRASNDGNLWSKYNRWFHIDVIEKSLDLNGQNLSIDVNLRASRPIIEFESNIKLYNFGTEIKNNVDLVDNFTKDAFSIIEGSIGYNIDGVDLTEGMRILFLADPDVLVNGRIFKVKFITFQNIRQISLVEQEDSLPFINQNVLVTNGNFYKGKYLFYNGINWELAQDKVKVNQPPLFDMFDNNDIWLKDNNTYPFSQFNGTKIFSYKIGEGIVDDELGFALEYKNIINSGDIIFEFNLLNDIFTYNLDNTVTQYKTDIAFLRRYIDRETHTNINGWIAAGKGKQTVIRLYVSDGLEKVFALDMYDDNTFINDLWLRVYVANQLKKEDTHYKFITDVNGKHYIEFFDTIEKNSTITIKTRSKKEKNEKGFYEIPASLEKNPLNANLNEFTFGEVLDHVFTIVEETSDITGSFPGNSNLRDVGNVSSLGKKFLKHSSLYNLYSYHLLDENANVQNAISFAGKEYSKFKRKFIDYATNSGFSGYDKQHVDRIISEINKDANESMPFYFSDMVPNGGQLTNSYKIIDTDEQYFALSKVFDINTPSYRAVNVYRNNKQLIYKKDYDFNDEGFVRIFGFKNVDDVIDIYEFESTKANFIPPTPTKLGLFPKYEPEIYIDTTVQVIPTIENGPFKIYGLEILEPISDNRLGWFYPLFKTYEEARDHDISLGGNGEFTVHKFNGLDTAFYMPTSDRNIAAQDTTNYNEWLQGQTVIQGHDGSLQSVFKDYRDNLILELEKRIYNNLKVEYTDNLFNIQDIISGAYRKTDTNIEFINNVLFKDFIDWTTFVNVEYAPHRYFDRLNSFTFNFSKSRLIDGSKSPGWWREIYKYLYDTDRPHTHPWEMLGFSVKPKWWDDEYGKGPYTKNNLHLWSDLENGIVRQPNFKINKKYVRPYLNKMIPVDAHGELLSPTFSNAISEYNTNYIEDSFKFGDGGPVESAWKKTSMYRFSLIAAIVINKPAYSFATGFDRIRQIRSNSGQIIYKDTNNHIQINRLVFPSTFNDTEDVITAGLLNYIVEYQNTAFLNFYKEYKENVAKINNQLSFKVGGFTDKSKLKLILDSRTPLNQGNVFIPEENYQIFLNTSFNIDEVIYSGVIVEKQPEGFYVRGYDKLLNKFPYYKAIPKDSDTIINIGGVSESFLTWEANKTYSQDSIVRVVDKFYRTKVTHVSQDSFDNSKFATLPSLPLTGGVDLKNRVTFEKVISYLDYGALFKKYQDVVDFLLGYGKYLESIGFTFDRFVANQYEVADWLFSAKQFCFWVTQSWKAGAVLTLSPGAEKINYTNSFAIVGNTLNSSLGYSILQADGTVINKNNLRFFKDNSNNFSVQPANINAGIYFIRLPLITKEHTVLIDDQTVFNDTIFDKIPGYRQERIKVLGYRTANWTGGLNIPGFFYDDAVAKEWMQWQDYNAGDLIKYKEFYYIATNKINGKEFFNYEDWRQLDKAPETSLYPNFDYKAEQFKDFYDLDSDNLDIEQQKLAQHLIGYQKRNYLQNIINNDVSQYKFYQGYIQEKGTKNSLTKLFDVLASAEKDSLEFYEEWAVRTGVYGGVTAFDEVDYVLEDTAFKLNPQPILLTDKIPTNETDLIYRIKSYEPYVRPNNYIHKPFPIKAIPINYFSTAGYVIPTEVEKIITEFDDILTDDIENYNYNDYVWVGDINKSWNVFRYKNYFSKIVSINIGEYPQEFFVKLDKIDNTIQVNDIIGIKDIIILQSQEGDSSVQTVFQNINDVKGFFKVSRIIQNKIFCIAEPALFSVIQNIDLLECAGTLSYFVKARANDIQDLKTIVDKNPDENATIWLDGDQDNNWKVLKTGSLFDKKYQIANPTFLDTNYGQSFAIDSRNTYLAVGSPDDSNGKVYVYSRASIDKEWKILTLLEPNDTDINSKFGYSIDITDDGRFLFVGAPHSSNLKTRIAGDFNENIQYSTGDIVNYNGLYYQALITILPAADAQTFEPFFNPSEFLLENNLNSENANLVPRILTGDYPTFVGVGDEPITTDHILLRVNLDLYNGVAINDEIILKWNKFTNANQSQINLIETEAFNGNIDFVDNPNLKMSDVLSQKHVIQNKVEYIITIDNAQVTPKLGDTISTSTAVGNIVYLYKEDIAVNNYIIYLNSVQGELTETGDLYISEILLGDYTIVSPVDNYFDGMLMIQIEPYYLPYNTTDFGAGLVIQEVITDSSVSNMFYYNILDYTITEDDTIPSLIRTFSYNGLNLDATSEVYRSMSYYALRLPKIANDSLVAGTQVSLYVNQLKKTVSKLRVRNTRFVLPPEVVAGEIIEQRNTGATATVYSASVVIEENNIDPTNPIYIIEIQFYSANYGGPAFNFVDEIFGSISGEIFSRPVGIIEDIYTSIEEIGFESQSAINDNNNGTEIWNLWDGYINYSENRYSDEGYPYVPIGKYYEDPLSPTLLKTDPGRTGQIIREKGTLNTAEVMYVQRNTPTNLTIYVDNVIGNWSKGLNFIVDNETQESQIEMLPYAGGIDLFGRPNIYTVAREIGVTNTTSIGYGDIGKLAVFKHSLTLPVIVNQATGIQINELIGQEYVVYKKETVEGLPQLPEIPSSISRVWQEINDIPIDNIGGTPSEFSNEGSVYIYERFGTNFVLIKQMLSLLRQDNHRFGIQVKCLKLQNEYRGYVVSADSDNDINYPGNLHLFKYTEDGEYYWNIARSKQYKGSFNDQSYYFAGNIVYFYDLANTFWVARTSITPGSWNQDLWSPVTELIDYTGILPNSNNLSMISDSAEISTLPNENLYDFATTFAISNDGEVIAIKVYYDSIDAIAIYRKQDGFYRWMQNINAPKTNINFGKSISLNNDGTILVVGAPKQTIQNIEEGVVYIYTQINGNFELKEILESPFAHSLGMFGEQVLINENILVVTSKNGETISKTTFDKEDTVFDENFTTFRFINENVGSVNIFHLLDGYFVYRHKISYTEPNKKLHNNMILGLKKNNIYMGIPRYMDYGQIVEYGKGNDQLWNVERESKNVVSLDKIKKVFLYDKNSKSLIENLDYIDPLQGKIAGTAEQNLSYKLKYDPAIYTVGSSDVDVIVNENSAWGKENVGKLWWDIGKIKYYYSYQSDISFSTNVWTKLWPNSSVDVYEWIASDLLPSQWDALSSTSEGFSQGISGYSKYGDNAYVKKKVYDSFTGKLSTVYYYWVKGITSIPNLDNRNLNSLKVANLIKDPKNEGYPFVAFINENEFSLFNCEKYLKNDDTVISIQYYNDDNSEVNNVHYQYKIITDGLETSLPTPAIETKWIDSLVGYDAYGRTVPDPSLSEKYKYGNLNEPRQGWFVNKQEALKQYIERVNRVLSKQLIVGNKNLDALYSQDEYPNEILNYYDLVVDNKSELDNYGIAKAAQAEIVLEIENGKVTGVTVINPGRGYLKTPTYTVIGKGTGLELEFELSTIGSISSVKILNSGKNYNQSAYVIIRKFTALVLSDETIFGKWALYERDYTANSWSRIQSQGYNCSLYWNFIDWYQEGYNFNTKINHIVEYSYQIFDINDSIGDIVKIQDIGDSGWLLLEKINDLENVDYTINYKTIGRQNGTIYFLPNLYDPYAAFVNFDLISYDTNFYDSIPSEEIRIIANAIKNDIFTGDLAYEYNQLFISTLKYVFHEQKNLDWVFKTNFLKIKHNVGTLRQDTTFNNDNLPSYEAYVKEVKPFKVKIREYLSAYEKIEESRSLTSDFDLPPSYNSAYKKILPQQVIALGDKLIGEENLQAYPYKSWLDNFSYEIIGVEIADGGKGYTWPPVLKFEGGGGSGASAICQIGDEGSIVSVNVTNSGNGYISAPRIFINGSLAEDGYDARLSVILGNSKSRSLKTAIKIDRITSESVISVLATEEQFVGSGSKYVFDLIWPISYDRRKIQVSINSNILLFSEYTYENVLDSSKGYDRYFGRVILTLPAENFANIVINYEKNQSLLTAQDRIQLFYLPNVGQFGNDLAQLMEGVDYGGVEVKSFAFGNKSGWDTSGFLTNEYDTYDTSYEDVTYIIPRNLLFIQASGYQYKAQINFVNFAKAVNAIVNGDSPNIPNRFFEIFNVDALGNSLEDSLDGTSILNVLDEIIEYIDEDLNVIITSRLTFNSANAIQEFSLGETSNTTVINNINTQILPIFDNLLDNDISDLFTEKILEDLQIVLPGVFEQGISYNVYKNNVRIDDENFGDNTLVTNPNALMQTIIGDGISNNLLLKDYAIEVEAGDVIVIRKSSSDGSYLPTDLDYDALLLGGNINYSNAQGIAAEEIIVDGDNFITPTTSRGTDEQIPGLIQDAVNITVYERPVAGTSNIVSRNYRGNGVQKNYNIGTTPRRKESTIVKINNVIQELDVDYSIRYSDNSVIFTQTPAVDSKISLITMGFSGDNILDFGTIIADGETSAFKINVRYEEDLYSQVTVNGENISYVLVNSDNEFNDSTKNVTIKFANKLSPGDIVKYAISFGSVQPYSELNIDDFVADGSSNQFILSQVPYVQEPAEWYTMVILNNKLLNPGYVETFVTTNSLEYNLKLYQVPLSSVSFNQLRIFLNERELQHLTEWNFTSAGPINQFLRDDQQTGSSIAIKRGLLSPGDILKVYINAWDDSTDSGGDYRYGYFEDGEFVKTPGKLHINVPLYDGDKIKVYQFSNHNTQNIDWQSFDVIERTDLGQGVSNAFAIRRVTDSNIIELDFEFNTNAKYAIYRNGIRIDDENFGTENASNPTAEILTPYGTGARFVDLLAIGVQAGDGDIIKIEQLQSEVILDEGASDWYELRRLRNGIVPLNSPAIDDQFVWVAKNGILLDPSVDYFISNDKMSVVLHQNLEENDNIQTIHFSGDKFQASFAWKQFNDILNQNHYNVVNGQNNITLAVDLQWYDKTIQVVNGDKLPAPTRNSKYPGVVVVDGERIEYWNRSGNILTQLRRGTLGTGVKQVHKAGTEIYDQSLGTIIPYKDETKSLSFVGNGVDSTFLLDFTPNSVNEFEVYVGGVRLRKTELTTYQTELGLDSPEADIVLPPEFSLDGNILNLTVIPELNQKITIIRRIGKIWTEPGVALSKSDNNIAKKIRSVQADLPR